MLKKTIMALVLMTTTALADYNLIVHKNHLVEHLCGHR